MMRAIWRYGLAMLAAAMPAMASAAAGEATPLFSANDVIHITITGPLTQIGKEAAKTETPLDGTITVTGASPETLPIKLSVRGITRRRGDVCTFPPLRVEFPAKPAGTSLFAGQKKLKLVTHCQGAQSFQQYQFLEYAAYRMYNVLTPYSFRVRLAAIDYVDANGKPLTSRLGFFVEDAGDVAKRNGLHEVKAPARIPSATLVPEDAARFGVFEDLIGNLDWAMNAGPAGTNCCHNARLLGAAKDATANLLPVPYDFDFAGMVDAPYATPPEGIELPNVRARRYRGFCRFNAQATTAAADILAKKAELLAVLDEVPQLNDYSRRKASKYLGDFFDQIATPQDVATNLLKTCL